MLIFDCEIKKMIQSYNDVRQPDLDYCEGWADYKGMGISVICCYDTASGTMHTLLVQDNQADADLFQSLISKTDYIVGFNNHGFDNKLVAAHGITIPEKKSYDIYEQVIAAAGLSNAPFSARKGFRLDDLAAANSLTRKTGDGGAMAPALYQRGELEKLYSYCANDVEMTVEVLDLICSGKLINPKSLDRLTVMTPAEKLGTTQAGLF